MDKLPIRAMTGKVIATTRMGAPQSNCYFRLSLLKNQIFNRIPRHLYARGAKCLVDGRRLACATDWT